MNSDQLVSFSKLNLNYQEKLKSLVKYYQYFKERKLVAGLCPRCEAKFFPPYELCPQCLEELQLVEIKPEGKIIDLSPIKLSFADDEQMRYKSFALIKLEGAKNAVLAAIFSSTPENLTKGIKVLARFSNDPKGSPTDIFFEPEEIEAEKELEIDELKNLSKDEVSSENSAENNLNT